MQPSQCTDEDMRFYSREPDPQALALAEAINTELAKEWGEALRKIIEDANNEEKR